MIEGNEVISARGAVAAGPPEAARIGARILEDGGNAMDAIAAACLAGCMLAPASAGIGGYVGSAVIRKGDDPSDRVWAVDANSVAPAAAHEGMYEGTPLGKEVSEEYTVLQGSQSINENEYACHVKGNANVFGPLAVGVPGALSAIGIIWERWGRLKWAQIVAPSQKLLADGLKLAGPDGIEHRPEMERTLARIAEAGWRDLYTGEIGREIVESIRRGGGILTREDMAAFEPRVTEPYTATYRDATVHSAILPNGGLSGLQMLTMMERFDPMPGDSVAHWHRLAEILKLAWRDRIRYLADPDFADVPMDRLLSKEYAAGRVETIRQFPDHTDALRPAGAGEGRHGTFHMSSADMEGNLASVTLSHGGGFGSKFIVPGTGIVLGHGMCRFDPRPGLVNSVAGRKRPLNNTCPLIVRLEERDIATGLPGGRRLISVSAQMVQRMVDSGATGYEAASSPRMHVGIREPLQLTESAGESIFEGLRKLGHTVEARGVAGSAHCAELLKREGKVRAGGNAWAAGSDF